MPSLPTTSLLLWLERLDPLPLELHICTLDTVPLHNTIRSLIPQASENAHSDRLDLVLVREAS